MQVVLIFKHIASVAFAPFEHVFSFHHVNEDPHFPPLPHAVVDLKSAHNDANEIKNIIGNLLHMMLFEALVKVDVAFHEVNQTV
jgi:hypothetical protein